jgi:hypothetical protein
MDITDIENNKKIIFLRNNDWENAYNTLLARYTTAALEGN